jgi:hypothetical protein
MITWNRCGSDFSDRLDNTCLLWKIRFMLVESIVRKTLGLKKHCADPIRYSLYGMMIYIG